MSVDLDGVTFAQAQVSGHTLQFLPDLAIVQVEDHFIRYALDAGDTGFDVLWVGGCGSCGRGRRGV
jgi:hypothetical protein